MTNLRKCILAVFAIATLGAGIAATTPHDWGQGFGAAAAAASAESGVCGSSMAMNADKRICP